MGLPTRSPDAQFGTPGNVVKIQIRRQPLEVVPEAKPGEQRVDRADLDARSTAFIAKFSGVDVVLAVGNQ